MSLSANDLNTPALLGLPAMGEPRDGAFVEVHVFALECSPAMERAAFASLDAVERARCGRFVFARDQLRYARTRYAMRRVVGERCGVPPHALRFGAGRYGRPYVEHAPCALDFNVSHAGNWIAIAMSCDALVGIDIDVAARIDDSLIGMLLRDVEYERFLRCDLHPRDRRLAVWWCAKEAFAKLNGVGLSLDPTAIDVAWTAQNFGAARSSMAPVIGHACLTVVDILRDAVCVVATAMTPRIVLRDNAW